MKDETSHSRQTAKSVDEKHFAVFGHRPTPVINELFETIDRTPEIRDGCDYLGY
jgi:hypothetical protein